MQLWAQEHGLGEVQIQEENQATLLVSHESGAFSLTLVHENPPSGPLILISDLGAIPVGNQEETFHAFAAANYLWQETDGATLSADPATHHGILAKRFYSPQCPSPAELTEIVNAFLDTTMVWRRCLRNQAFPNVPFRTEGPPLDEEELRFITSKHQA